MVIVGVVNVVDCIAFSFLLNALVRPLSLIIAIC